MTKEPHELTASEMSALFASRDFVAAENLKKQGK